MARTRPRWRREKKREPEQDARAVRLRLGLIRLAIFALFLILVAQLWKLQIVSSDYYRVRANHNRLRESPLEPARGVIVARGGEKVVQNVPSYTVEVTPADVPLDRTDEIAARVGKLVDVPAEEIVSAIQARRARRQIFDKIPVKVGVDPDVAFRLSEMQSDLPGVHAHPDQLRQYIGGVEMSQILGYLGRISAEEYDALQPKDDSDTKGYQPSDLIGKAGVEATYESELRGKIGRTREEVDVTGKTVLKLGEVPPVNGNTVRLSIDLDLQRKVTEILQPYLDKAKQAVAIVGNPKTGQIYALVSIPSFDNNIFTKGVSQKDWDALNTDKRFPMLDHGISSNNPPGSIFKIISASAALQEGVATPATTITSKGTVAIKNDYDPRIQTIFRDTAVGTFNLYDALAVSSNTYFYYLAGGNQEAGFIGLGIDRLAAYSRNFGLGSPTRIDLPGEVRGLVPDGAWKVKNWNDSWRDGDTYNFGIGQGFLLTTPIQMWNATNAIANGGTLYEPRVVRDILDDGGNVLVPFKPQVLRRVGVDDGHLADVRLGMRQAVERGTAANANIPGLLLAAKTGTAEFGQQDPKTGLYETSHAWFTGFAPMDDPQISVLVFIERGIGSQDATPAAAKILRYIFQQRPSLPQP